METDTPMIIVLLVVDAIVQASLKLYKNILQYLVVQWSPLSFNGNIVYALDTSIRRVNENVGLVEAHTGINQKCSSRKAY